jgi:hypothetical protein
MKSAGLLPGRERLTALLLFVLLTISYGYVFPRWADPNQNSRLDMVVAVVDQGTFQIDPYVHNTVDYAKVGDHYYSDKAPGTAFLGIPLYAGLKLILDQPIMNRLTDKLANSAAFQSTLRSDGSGVLADKVRFALAQVVLTFVIVTLPSAVLGALLYLLLARFTRSQWQRLGVVLGYALLTPVLAYAGAFYGHQLAAVTLFAAFYILFMSGPELSSAALLAVGLLLGASVIIEYPAALIVAILCVYAFYRLRRAGHWRRIGWVLLAGGIMALGLMAYNTKVFGGPFSLGYSHSELWLPEHDTGFMSLTYPHWAAIWGMTFGIFRGLFVLSPWLLLAAPGFVLWWRSREHRAELWVALASVLAFLWFNASSVMWWGGFSIGPRYLMPMLPFLALPIVFVLRQWGQQAWLAVLFAALAAWSLVATWGLTLADQAFPPDTIPNPYLNYAWPSWLAGNLARNVGTLLGLRGAASLVPLVLVLLLLAAAWWQAGRQTTPPDALPMAAATAPAAPGLSEPAPDGYARTAAH